MVGLAAIKPGRSANRKHTFFFWGGGGPHKTIHCYHLKRCREELLTIQ